MPSSKFKQGKWEIGRLAAILVLSSMTSSLQAGGLPGGYLDVATRVSSLGLGLELGYAIKGSNFNLRAQVNQFDADYNFEEDGVEYEADLELSTFGLLADWHPMGGAFRLTAGLYSNGNQIAGAAEGAGSYQVGEATFVVDPADNFRLGVDIDLGNEIIPYAGLGWGFSPNNSGGLLITADIGVLLQGSPSVELTASGTATYQGSTVNLAEDPAAQEQVQVEEKRLQDDLSELDVYPVVSIGVGFRF